MKLAEYLAAERGRCAQLARAIGIAPSYLWQMAHGRRPVPPDVAPTIEAASKHAVRRWDLRPQDWHRIWPDLQQTGDADDAGASRARSPVLPDLIAHGETV
jgi:DNA-binding transcriptional regulator YdaS (Cro superfamily)